MLRILAAAVLVVFAGAIAPEPVVASEADQARDQAKQLDTELKKCRLDRNRIETDYDAWQKDAERQIDELAADKDMEADEKHAAVQALKKKLRSERAGFQAKYNKNVDKTQELWAKLHRVLDRLKKLTGGGGGSGQVAEQPSDGGDEQRGGVGRRVSDEEIQRIMDDYEREMHKVEAREDDPNWKLGARYVPSWERK